MRYRPTCARISIWIDGKFIEPTATDPNGAHSVASREALDKALNSGAGSGVSARSIAEIFEAEILKATDG